MVALLLRDNSNVVVVAFRVMPKSVHPMAQVVHGHILQHIVIYQGTKDIVFPELVLTAGVAVSFQPKPNCRNPVCVESVDAFILARLDRSQEFVSIAA